MRRLFVVGTVAAAMLAITPIAGATEYGWRYGWLAGGSKDASGSFDGLRRSEAVAQSGMVIDVAAHYPGSWSLYGSWAEGYGTVCHGYSGANTLGGIVWNPEATGQYPVPATIAYPSWESAC